MCVKIRTLTARAAAAVLLVVALAGHEAAAFAATLRAHACCARAKGSCGQMGSPDDCCSRMGHLSARPMTATATSALDLSAPVVPFSVRVLSALPSAFVLQTNERAKRPHDPPHLH